MSVLRGIEVKSRFSEIATKLEKKNIWIFLNFVALSEYIDFTYVLISIDKQTFASGAPFLSV